MKNRDEEPGECPDFQMLPATRAQLVAQYAQYTHQAAALERAGMFGEAAVLWHAGGECAQVAQARFWCETREAMCLRSQRLASAQPPPRRS